jgi:hypothetical protein
MLEVPMVFAIFTPCDVIAQAVLLHYRSLCVNVPLAAHV